MSNVPYGNKGPDCRVRLTGRIGYELNQLMSGSYRVGLSDLKVPPDYFEPLRKIISEARSVETGHTMNLGLYDPLVLEALRRCLKAVERYCGHTQVAKAARKRRTALDDYLGVSAVDRLAEIA